MENIENGNQLPFKHKIKPIRSPGNKEFAAFQTFEGADNYVIRKIGFEKIPEELEGVTDPHESIKIIKGLFNELTNEYGINIPAEHVVGRDKSGESKIFTLTEKIEGHLLEEAKKEYGDDKKFIVELKKLFASLTRYLKDKYEKGGYRMWDIFVGRQYMYGHTKDSEEKKIYLIDTDTEYISKYPNYGANALDLGRFIKDYERELNLEFPNLIATLEELHKKYE